MDAEERAWFQPRLLVTLLPRGQAITAAPMTSEERVRLRIAKTRMHARLGMPLASSGSRYRSDQRMSSPNG